MDTSAAALPRRLLPIGIQNLREIRQDKHYYVDKTGLGLDLRVEDATNHGRIDLTLCHAGQVFVFEFKVVDERPDGSALAQIRARGYADKYLGQGQPVHLVGIEFSRARRNLVGMETQTLPSVN